MAPDFDFVSTVVYVSSPFGAAVVCIPPGTFDESRERSRERSRECWRALLAKLRTFPSKRRLMQRVNHMEVTFPLRGFATNCRPPRFDVQHNRPSRRVA